MVKNKSCKNNGNILESIMSLYFFIGNKKLIQLYYIILEQSMIIWVKLLRSNHVNCLYFTLSWLISVQVFFFNLCTFIFITLSYRYY
jgi:hypothetical protein